MNIQMYGETAAEKMAAIMTRNKAMLDKIVKANTAVSETIKEAPPGTTVEEINAVVKEKLRPTEKKTSMLTYAALAAGAYLIFK